MAREARSHVRKRRRGCVGGCLTRIVLLLGMAALLFVAACVLGFVKNDPVTGKPSLTLENIGMDSLPEIKLPDMSGVTAAVQGGQLPGWAYGVGKTGLTVKTLRAGDGEAVLVCSDGYTMLLGGGSGMGITLASQLLLCGVTNLHAAAALSADAQQIGGLPLVISLMPPDYLLYQDTQVKGTAYNRLVKTAQQKSSLQMMTPERGLTFSLGRATVTVIGPVRTPHTDGRDDGLSFRIDYGNTSVLIMGAITENGERELISSRVNLNADALICAGGGADTATCAEFVSAVSPSFALMTGKNAANAVRVRLERTGAEVYGAKEHGVMTLYSDGYTMRVQP